MRELRRGILGHVDENFRRRSDRGKTITRSVLCIPNSYSGLNHSVDLV